MKASAPILHDDPSVYDGAPQDILVKDIPNVLNRLTWEKGDIERGFREADLVLEHTFRIPIHHQGYLEPQSFLVNIAADGQVNAWASTKSPFGTRAQFAKAAGLSASQIRVHAVHVGADFGGKSGAGELPICYFLAKQAGRPVKILLTHSEELTAMNPDHDTVVRIKTGVKRDGRMTARYLQAIHGTGAYAGMKPGRASIGGAGSAGPYKIDNTYMEALQVYSNTVPCGFWRAPETAWHGIAVNLQCFHIRIVDLVRSRTAGAADARSTGFHACVSAGAVNRLQITRGHSPIALDAGFYSHHSIVI